MQDGDGIGMRLREASQVLRATLGKLVGEAGLASDLMNFGRFALDSDR